MKSFTKLPLFLGVAVLVLAVIISAIKIGNKQAFTNTNSRANVAGASLILKYTAPNLVSVILTSEKEISGSDITLKFDSGKITILPSSLLAGADFVISGGNVDQKASLFSFSALAKKAKVTSGIVATFTVKPLDNLKAGEADVQFVTSSTTVVDKASSQNILSQTQGVKFNLSAK